MAHYIAPRSESPPWHGVQFGPPYSAAPLDRLTREQILSIEASINALDELGRLNVPNLPWFPYDSYMAYLRLADTLAKALPPLQGPTQPDSDELDDWLASMERLGAIVTVTEYTEYLCHACGESTRVLSSTYDNRIELGQPQPCSECLLLERDVAVRHMNLMHEYWEALRAGARPDSFWRNLGIR